ncbi:MAG: hypothetical protein KBC56_08135 [Flavobacterium sp.]|nr:hypothetical protein [Flavobacterium sp.]
MEAQKIQKTDYEKFVDWWKWNRFPIPPSRMLPNNGLGGLKIVSDGGIDICAGFLFETNSGIAWIEFIVANPDIKDKKIRHESQIMLIANLTVEAEEKGFEAVFSSVKNPSLIKKFIEVGYTPNQTTELMIKIN